MYFVYEEADVQQTKFCKNKKKVHELFSSESLVILAYSKKDAYKLFYLHK